MQSYLKRNVDFDNRRSKGISEVYEGKTLNAVTTFKDAQKVKPDDSSVQLWLDVIKQAAQKPRNAAPGSTDEFRQFSGQGAQPGTAVAPAMPAAPTLPRPAVADTRPVSVDPRAVF